MEGAILTMSKKKVLTVSQPPVFTVTLNRPDSRNAVDRETAEALAEAFRHFDADDSLRVAILTGSDSNFCAGADLKAAASGDPGRSNRIATDGDGPMGPSRMRLSKPVIAAVSGHAVAGGLELALWCDLRVADESAVFGVYCRRFGVPLIDGGTFRLPRLIGHSRAMDMILTGRAVHADEALQFGLVNRLVQSSELMAEAKKLALEIAAHPQQCLRNDRRSAYEQWSLSEDAALKNEFALGLKTLQSGETLAGAARFASGDGRHGKKI